MFSLLPHCYGPSHDRPGFSHAVAVRSLRSVFVQHLSLALLNTLDVAPTVVSLSFADIKEQTLPCSDSSRPGAESSRVVSIHELLISDMSSGLIAPS